MPLQIRLFLHHGTVAQHDGNLLAEGAGKIPAVPQVAEQSGKQKRLWPVHSLLHAGKRRYADISANVEFKHTAI
jgi:hypothetical protein